MRSDLERAQRLLQRLLEGPPDRHRLADRLHLRSQLVGRAAKLLEREARNLGHHVVDRRLEARRRHARDVVGNLVEPVADRQPRRDLGDRKSGRLRRQRRAARHARVHLDHDHPSGRRLDRKLDVRSAGIDADFADDPNRGVAHDLVFLVGQRLRGRDRYRIAGMHAHRIEVLDRADDHDVVRRVAHHLELEFLPSFDRLLDQHFVARRLFESVRHLGAIVVEFARDRAARPAQRSRRPDDHRQAELAQHPLGVGRRTRDRGARHLEPDLQHRLLEQVAILGLLDRLELRADKFALESIEHARLGKLDRQVQRGLPADRRQHRVRPLALDNLRQHRQPSSARYRCDPPVPDRSLSSPGSN